MPTKEYMRKYYWSHPEYRQRCKDQSKARNNKCREDILTKYCCEPISNIENYALAKADKFKGWDLHHRLEIHEDYRNSRKDMILMNIYWKRPAAELIFIPRNEHKRIHKNGFKLSDEAKLKIAAVHKGKPPWNKKGPGKTP